MNYLTDQSLSETIDIFDKLAEQESFDLVLWFYPSTVAKQLPESFRSLVNDGWLKPVTEYEGSTISARTEQASYASDQARFLLGCIPSCAQFIDSVALYRPGSTEWTVASVIHERGMVLVRESKHAQALKAEGFAFSSEAPSWW